jgi:hypothetical protein
MATREIQESRCRVLKFRWIEGKFAVCRLAGDAAIPEWVACDPFRSITRTADELSVVCRQECVPADVSAESNWCCLKLEGPFPFAEVGILVSVLQPLSSARIPIFAISTFDTDYVLVKQEFRDRASQALIAAGHERIG